MLLVKCEIFFQILTPYHVKSKQHDFYIVLPFLKCKKVGESSYAKVDITSQSLITRGLSCYRNSVLCKDSEDMQCLKKGDKPS
jgi:hypothetical protein